MTPIRRRGSAPLNELLSEAFRHGAWATRTLIAACRALPVEQLRQSARGYGSMLATLNHVVLSDAIYATILTGTRTGWMADGSETDDLDQLEARVDETERLWKEILTAPLDSERRLTLDAGEYECHASVVIAQALHHGAAHREQVRAALAILGIRPPDLQPWAYAVQCGRAHWRREKR